VARFYEWGKRVGVLFQKLDDVADGDGSSPESFNQIGEIQSLREQITNCGGTTLAVTETLYSVIVGDLS
jgi:geranylgeranyl pyrophosphate synthase